MKKNRPWLWIVGLSMSAALSLVTCDCHAQQEAQFSPDAIEWFEREVRPLLAEHCSSCHSNAVGKQKGGLNLDSRESILIGGESGPAIVVGKPDESLLIEAIRHESFEMPPEKSLSQRDQQTLVEWVERGAPWPVARPNAAGGENWLEQRFGNHWAWTPVAKRPVPSIAQDAWCRSPIDRFILKRLNENDLEPAPECDADGLLRRLSFDLIGLPLVVAASSQAASEPPALPAKDLDYKDKVERLLSSPQFGVRWGRHWMDLVRYAETLGHEFDFPARHAWQYRDAVVDTFNTDVPYDRMLIEHLAGDQVNNARRHPVSGIDQSLALTGFWWLGDSLHAPVDIIGDWATRVDNQIEVVSKTFMGMTVACARCHDHKFDAISLQDYYGLAGIIESSRRIYAITDPTGQIARHNKAMLADIQRADDIARKTFLEPMLNEEQIRDWVQDYVAALRDADPKEGEKSLPFSDPFYALQQLTAVVAGSEQEALLADANQETNGFVSRLSVLVEKVEEAEASFQVWQSNSPQFAEFSRGLPAGWTVQAISDGHKSRKGDLQNGWLEPNKSGSFDWFSESLPIPHRIGIFASQKVGRKQHVSLRSPTFDLERPVICIKMRGKSAQSSVVVSNYFMREFNDLLFKDLRKPIDQLSDSGWVTHAGDLNKYIGHPTFLSIEDEENAWFEIEEVRFSDRKPTARPDSTTLNVLRSEIRSEQELLGAYARQIETACNESVNADPSEHNVTLMRALIRTSLKHDLELPVLLDELRSTATELQERDTESPDPTMLLAITDGTPRDVAIALRGNPHIRGDVVRRGCFVSLPSYMSAQSDSSGRMEFARSLVGKSHPLTARVIVNRIWYHLMGRGLVNSPDNLGVLGGRPTHPELLDYLAAELVRHDWSIKWLVREIVLSSTYRLSSVASDQHRQRDADGSLWSYRPVRRLSAEALRDTMLVTTGSLDGCLGGPSIPVHLNDQMTGRGRPKDSGPLDGAGRRSVYVEVRRNFLDPFLLAFDFPMPATSIGRRSQSNVPAQALGLLNDPLVSELAQRWVAATEHISDPRQRVATMLATAYSRPARPNEIEQCQRLLDANSTDQPWVDLAHVLLNSKEFCYIK